METQGKNLIFGTFRPKISPAVAVTSWAPLSCFPLLEFLGILGNISQKTLFLFYFIPTYKLLKAAGQPLISLISPENLPRCPSSFETQNLGFSCNRFNQKTPKFPPNPPPPGTSPFPVDKPPLRGVLPLKIFIFRTFPSLFWGAGRAFNQQIKLIKAAAPTRGFFFTFFPVKL